MRCVLQNLAEPLRLEEIARAAGFSPYHFQLLDAGADPSIRDSEHDGDAIGWAEFFKQPEVVRLLRERTRSTR